MPVPGRPQFTTSVSCTVDGAIRSRASDPGVRRTAVVASQACKCSAGIGLSP